MFAQIAPSLLAADYAHLAADLQRIESAGAKILHLDIMDGHFVKNISFGAAIVAALRPLTKMNFDVHLMVAEPEKFLPAFAAAGADEITVHIEAVNGEKLRKLLAKIAELKIKRGISLNPNTPISSIREWVDEIDLILLMSVFPGEGGQKFMPESLTRLRDCREIIGGREIVLSIDGGINSQNAAEIRAAGATRLVAGTAVFEVHENLPQVLKHLAGAK